MQQWGANKDPLSEDLEEVNIWAAFQIQMVKKRKFYLITMIDILKFKLFCPYQTQPFSMSLQLE